MCINIVSLISLIHVKCIVVTSRLYHDIVLENHIIVLNHVHHGQYMHAQLICTNGDVIL